MTKRITRGLALAALLAIAACALAQDDPYQALRTYDGQNRKAQLAIQKAIQDAGQDKSALGTVETGLIGVIQDKDATLAGKQDACRFLWIVGSDKSVPALAKLLTAEETCNLAIYALSRNPAPSAAAALRAAVKRTSGKFRVGIVNALGNRADAASVPLLKKLTASTDPVDSEAAIAALGKIGTPASLAALKALPTDSVLAGNAIVHAASLMAGSKAKAEAALLAVASSNRPAVPRAEAIVALAKMGSAKAADTAAACLAARDEYLAVVAARACGRATDTSATKRAVAAFPKLGGPVQTALLAAWADRREAAATAVVLASLKCTDATVRMAAIRYAGRIAGARAVAPLAEVLAKGDGPDKESAKRALAAMPSKDADEGLVALAKSGTPEARAAVMGVLAERPTPKSRAVLLEAAAGSETYSAQAALKGPAQAPVAQDYPALIKILVSATDDGVRDTAREAVVATARQMPDDGAAAAPLLEALNSASVQGRAAAMPALAEIGGDAALAALKRAAGSDNAEVKQAAVGALADSCSDSKALPILMDLAKVDASKSVRVQALRGYIRLAGSAERRNPNERVKLLSAAIDAAERPDEKRQAIGVLRQCRTQQAVELAARCLDDADLFDDAAATIIALASRQDNRKGVQGPAVNAALDKIIATTKDESQREEAKKLRGE